MTQSRITITNDIPNQWIATGELPRPLASCMSKSRTAFNTFAPASATAFPASLKFCPVDDDDDI